MGEYHHAGRGARGCVRDTGDVIEIGGCHACSRHSADTGPCPPPIHGAHDYRFRLFASDIELELPKSTTQEELYRALDNHVLAMGELIGTYNR